MTTAATGERRAFCDLLDEVGPDADTLCEGWTTRDLAAHVIVRERRPDAAAGVVVRPLSGYTARVQAKVADRPWGELVDTIRSGPPRLSPMRLDAVDRAANTVEFFVHHEDVRRARDGWEPRELPAELVEDLASALRRGARLLVRRAPVGIVLEPTDGHPVIVAKRSEPSVTLRAPVSELVMFVYGRQAQARVELDGPDDAVEALRSASLGA